MARRRAAPGARPADRRARHHSTRWLLRGLRDGFRAGIVWDAYDNFHGHDDAWTLWGIMHTASRHRYTPKKRYWAARQLYRFVPPGSWRVGEELAVFTVTTVQSPPSVSAFRPVRDHTGAKHCR